MRDNRGRFIKGNVGHHKPHSEKTKQILREKLLKYFENHPVTYKPRTTPVWNKGLKGKDLLSQELLRRMDEWRDSYTCDKNCWEWKKWKFCQHLRKARAKIFEKEIEMQMCQDKFEKFVEDLKKKFDKNDWENNTLDVPKNRNKIIETLASKEELT